MLIVSSLNNTHAVNSQLYSEKLPACVGNFLATPTIFLRNELQHMNISCTTSKITFLIYVRTGLIYTCNIGEGYLP